MAATGGMGIFAGSQIAAAWAGTFGTGLGAAAATGALAGAASGAIMTGTLQGTLKGALFGAISAGVAYGIGHGGGLFAKVRQYGGSLGKATLHGPGFKFIVQFLTIKNIKSSIDIFNTLIPL